MYLNSTPHQSAWDTIAQRLEKPVKKIFQMAKQVKTNAKKLKILLNIKILSREFQTWENKKYLEITYAKALHLINTLHPTWYKKT